MKLIKRIAGLVETTGKEINIGVEGRNVVIIGGNGSGKTSLLNSLHQQLINNITNGEWQHITQTETNIIRIRNELDKPDLSTSHSGNLNYSLIQESSRLKAMIHPLKLEYNEASSFIQSIKDKSAAIHFFEAWRKADIQRAGFASASQISVQEMDMPKLGSRLEQYLVSLRVRAALGALEERDNLITTEIQSWFEHFTDGLKYLFEDESTTLVFDPNLLNFTIRQNEKNSFNFQNLSSGYLAVLDIYADLLMRSRYLGVIPSKLEGVVLIDEIDVHLHVSLQRKIFPFLTKAFPSVQFIVTTHSPFVLMSVSEALIYDLSTGTESIDLSMYSVESVLEGIFGVPPISERLEETIKEVVALTNSDNFDTVRAEQILKKVEPSYDFLDDETKMFYQIARNKVLNMKSKGA